MHSNTRTDYRDTDYRTDRDTDDCRTHQGTDRDTDDCRTHQGTDYRTGYTRCNLHNNLHPTWALFRDTYHFHIACGLVHQGHTWGGGNRTIQASICRHRA